MVERTDNNASSDEEDGSGFGQEAVDFKPDPWFQPPKIKPNWKSMRRKTDLLVVPKSRVCVTSFHVCIPGYIKGYVLRVRHKISEVKIQNLCKKKHISYQLLIQNT